MNVNQIYEQEPDTSNETQTTSSNPLPDQQDLMLQQQFEIVKKFKLKLQKQNELLQQKEKKLKDTENELRNMKSKCNQETIKYVELRGKFYQCMNEYEDLLSIKEKYDRMEGQLKEKTQFSSDEIKALKQENEKIHTVFIQQLEKYNKAMMCCLIVIIPFVIFTLFKVLSQFHTFHEFFEDVIRMKSGFEVSIIIFVLAIVLIAKLDMIQNKDRTRNFKRVIKEDEFLKSPMVFSIYLSEFISIVLLDCLSPLGLNRLLLFFIAFLLTKFFLYYPYYVGVEDY